MKKLIYILFLLSSSIVFAQEDSTIVENPVRKPVLGPWHTGTFIDQQTTYTTRKNHLELEIHHRFTAVDNGITDLFGFYGASNIRLGLNYGITDNLMIGFGSEKDKKMQQFLVKYRFLDQSKDGVIPVSVALFASTCINTREQDYFGLDYSFSNRMSYYTQLIISRKWTPNFSTMIGAGYAHINKVESTRVETEDSVSETVTYYPKYYNDAIGLSFSARYKIGGKFNIVAQYEQPFAIGKKSGNGHGSHSEHPKPIEAKPGLALGFEITTLTHSFQMFASSYRGIIPQNNLIMNNFDFTEKSGIMLGFNVVVKF